MRLIRKFAVLVAAGLMAISLGACGLAQKASQPIGQQTVNDLRNTVYALKSSYGVALRLAVGWARQPTCGPKAPAPPLCSTPAGIQALAKAQLTAADALNRAEDLALAATPDATALGTAVQAAQKAYGAFTTAMVTWGAPTPKEPAQ